MSLVSEFLFHTGRGPEIGETFRPYDLKLHLNPDDVEAIHDSFMLDYQDHFEMVNNACGINEPYIKDMSGFLYRGIDIVPDKDVPRGHIVVAKQGLATGTVEAVEAAG